MAVSKYQSLDKIRALHQEGQKIFGENYVQELLEKKSQLSQLKILDSDFHFIGRLQSNKIKILLPHVSTIHSVDSLKLLEGIHAQARELRKKTKIYIQVNLDEEPTKGGFLVDFLPELSDRISAFTSIECLGLMAIPDPAKDVERAFQKIAELSRQYRTYFGAGLSIGMSSDYELAIQYGATSVRIGSALFGSRN